MTTVPRRYRRTDGRTDGQTDNITARHAIRQSAVRASRGKIYHTKVDAETRKATTANPRKAAMKLQISFKPFKS